jgi:hypothetical protein
MDHWKNHYQGNRGDSLQAIPEECFEWSRMNEYVVDVCEVSEVGVNLQDPVRLNQDNSTNVDQ